MLRSRFARLAATLWLLVCPRLATAQAVVVGGEIPSSRQAPGAPTGTGLVLGRVIDPGDGRPVPGALARLVLAGGSAQSPGVITDSQGRFVFRDLPKGRFSVSASKTGYVNGRYGKHLPDTGLDVQNDSQLLELADDEHRGDIVVKLWKYAAIGGTVRDERGDPIVGIAVRALAATYVGGRRHYALEDLGGGAPAITDDRGMFRFHSLIPGEYIVAVPVVSTTFPRSLERSLASTDAPPPKMYSDSSYGNMTWSTSGGLVPKPIEGSNARFGFTVGDWSPGVAGRTSDGRLLIYEMQFYPNASSLDRASPVTLGSGEERSSVDFNLSPVTAVSVSGRVIGPGGAASDLILQLVRADSNAMTSDPAVSQTVTDVDGTFTFLGIAQGDYTITAIVAPRPRIVMPVSGGTTVTSAGGTIVSGISLDFRSTPQPPEAMFWAAQRVAVGGEDVRDVSLTLQRGARVTGRVEIQGAKQGPLPSYLSSFYVERADGTQSKNLGLLLGRVDQQNNAASLGQPPGKYFIRVPFATSDWFFAGAMYQGRDLSIDPIELSGEDIDGIVFIFRDTPGAEISGGVRHEGGTNIDYRAAVGVFPVDRSSWGAVGQNPRNFKTSGVLGGGRYVVADLPPGDYFVATLPQSRRDWLDPAVLEVLSRTAQRVTVGAGEKKTVDLSLPRGTGGADDEEWSDAGHGPWVADDQSGDQPGDQAQGPPRDIRPAAPAGSGVIAGVVVTGDPREPLRRAQVVLTGKELLGSRTAITDEEGRFSFTGLPAGRFTLQANRAAYLPALYGSSRPGRPGTPITLIEGQRLQDITLPVVRGGVITGVVRDDRGQPVNDASVQLMQYRTVDGTRRLWSYLPSSIFFNASTDDRGVFRFYGVESGEYAVAASMRSVGASAREVTASDVQFAQDVVRLGSASVRSPVTAPTATATPAPPDTPRTVVFVPVFYPGTADPTQARLITVAAGQEVAGIDFALQFVPAATISGAVTPALPNLEARLVNTNPPAGSGSMITAGSRLSARSIPDGRFLFPGIPPGTYTIAVTTAAATGRGAGGAVPSPMWALAEVSVSGEDISGVALTLQPAMTVGGSMSVDATALTPPPLSALRLSLVPILTGNQVSVGQTQVAVGDDGKFSLSGVMPGRYLPRALTPTGVTGWIVRSAMLDGQDVMDSGFDVRPGEDVSGLSITFTDRSSEISGTLQDASGRPAPDYFIIVFPIDKALWRSGARRIQQVRPGTDGTFVVKNLVAGRYYLAALTDVTPGEWFEPTFLEQLVNAAMTLTLAEGEKKVQDVQIRK